VTNPDELMPTMVITRRAATPFAKLAIEWPDLDLLSDKELSAFEAAANQLLISGTDVALENDRAERFEVPCVAVHVIEGSPHDALLPNVVISSR
jgi:hypothetical protein